MADPKYLLDTNILAYLVTNRWPALSARASEHKKGALVTSALCLAEALAGDRTAEEIALILRLMERIPPLSFDEAAARAFSTFPYKRRRIDRFIAAQALSLDLVVVTDNEADFEDVSGIKIENWTLAE